MTTVVTRGAASAQALGYAARATAANYIEDVFSTYLYTGAGTGITIQNGIDLSTKGGLVWTKRRSSAQSHYLSDTDRGTGKTLSTDATTQQLSIASLSVSAFNTDGFSYINGDLTTNGQTYASWTFRKQAKFFDIVTYTGNGANRTISHNLGSVPGAIWVKRTDVAADWQCYHRSLANTQYMVLNTTAAVATGATRWNSTTPTDTVFSLGTDATVNASGSTYVAYLFAHDAGGFGASGTDNVITCGSFTGTGSDVTVNLGYEPQWLLVKRATGGTDNWALFDNMRGMFVNFDDNILFPNLSNAELVGSGRIAPTSTGFIGAGGVYAASSVYIYIAIRRGPMRTPTSGTSVFAPVARTGTGAEATITSNFAPDAIWSQTRNFSQDDGTFDKLRGKFNLRKTSTGAEYAANNSVTGYTNTGVTLGEDTDTGAINTLSSTYANWAFRRAPGFFDVVCYTGTGSLRTVTHNLGATPELLIVKRRATAEDWNVYSATTGNAAYLRLNTDAAVGTAGADALWGSTTPTSSVFTVKTSGGTNASGGTYVAYLFASVAGVSKVGTYTGSGTTKQIDCGFTGGARFVLIKRTNSTGDWYVWDSARGIVAGNDPYLLLNSKAAEVTNTDYVDTYSAGFELSSTAPAAINANGGTFIFLAIA